MSNEPTETTEPTPAPTQEQERPLGPNRIKSEIEFKAKQFEAQRLGLFSDPEFKKSLEECGVSPDAFRDHLKRVERNALKGEYNRLRDNDMRLWHSQMIRQPVSPEEWEEHKQERREAAAGQRRVTVLTRGDREVEETDQFMYEYDRAAELEEELELQALVSESIGPGHPLRDPRHPEHEAETAKVQAAQEKMDRVNRALQEGATVRQLLDILED